MDKHTDTFRERIIRDAAGLSASPPAGHEERFAAKLTAATAAIGADRRTRRRKAAARIMSGAAAASLLWTAAYGFFGMYSAEKSADPFEAKMASINQSYRLEIRRLSENILRSASTPGERTAAEDGLRRFSKTQLEFEKNVASDLPRSPEGIRALHTHYTSSINALRLLGRNIRECDSESTTLIII
jgi:hypothetical protein